MSHVVEVIQGTIESIELPEKVGGGVCSHSCERFV